MTFIQRSSNRSKATRLPLPNTIAFVFLVFFFIAKANATGRNAKTVREFLEKNYNAEEMENEEKVVKLAIRALLEVVQSGSKNLELAIMRRGHSLKMLEVDEIEKHVAAIEKEKEEEAEKKKQKK